MDPDGLEQQDVDALAKAINRCTANLTSGVLVCLRPGQAHRYVQARFDAVMVPSTYCRLVGMLFLTGFVSVQSYMHALTSRCSLPCSYIIPAHI